MIFADTNYPATLAAHSGAALCGNRKWPWRSLEAATNSFVSPQNIIEFWSVTTRPVSENGFGLSATRAAAEIAMLLRLFHLLPYRSEVLDAWRRIVLAQGVVGKQTHDAHIVAMMEVHSVTSILTFNDAF